MKFKYVNLFLALILWGNGTIASAPDGEGKIEGMPHPPRLGAASSSLAATVSEKDEATLNDILVERGDQEAIRRKLEGLTRGGDRYYAPNPNYNYGETTVPYDYGRSVRGRSPYWPAIYPAYGYRKNPEAARELNDTLVERGDQRAILRKLEGLTRGGDCNPNRRRVSDSRTSSYPIDELDSYPTYGYRKNPEAARELNDTLVERGDQQAILRKLEALTRGGDFHVRRAVLSLSLADDPYELDSYPTYGYRKNPEAAKEFDEFIKIRPALSEILKRVTPLEEVLLKVILRYMA